MTRLPGLGRVPVADRLPAAGFTALAFATAAAFFITQHLKVSTPLIAGFPAPVPAAIDPYGSRCGEVSHEVSRFSFYLLNGSDSVNVNIVDASTGRVVRHLARNHFMRNVVRNPDGDFSWDGRDDAGRVAADGSYLIRVTLLHHDRTVTISNTSGPESIRVETAAPRPRVTAVMPHQIARPGVPVVLSYQGNEDRGGTVRLFRTDVLQGGLVRPRLVKSFLTPWRGQQATWNARIDHRPAPQGTYLVGLDVTDAACSTGHFPEHLPPRPGSTRGAGVTISYLSALPPVDGIAAGDGDRIPVRSAGRFTWSVLDGSRTLQRGQGSGDTTVLPQLPSGVYTLRLRSMLAAADVPLIVKPTAAGLPRVLAVLPVVSWEGQSPVDDDGDGIPDVLSAGSRVRLPRPVVDGPPAGFPAQASLLDALAALGDHPSPVADLGLASVSLQGVHGVLLPGGERWLPAGLAPRLAAWVRGGGHLVSFGAETLLRTAVLTAHAAIPVPGVSARDPFGVPARAGCATTPCVITERLGRGTVTEVRSEVGRLPATQASRLLRRLWTALTRGR